MSKLIQSEKMKKFGYITAFSIVTIVAIYDLFHLLFLKFMPTSHFGIYELDLLTVPFHMLGMIFPNILDLGVYSGFLFLIFRRIWVVIGQRQIVMPSTLTAPLWGVISISLILIFSSCVFDFAYRASLLIDESGINHLAAISAYLLMPALFLLPIGICLVEFFSFLFDRHSTANQPSGMPNDTP